MAGAGKFLKNDDVATTAKLYQGCAFISNNDYQKFQKGRPMKTR